MEISVIIPCFNAYHLMTRCLEALEKQTYNDFEVIVIDDCSLDDSYDKLLEYSRQTKLQMQVFKTRLNVGPGEARNIAIGKTKGKYLAFCDSDDWYADNYLEKMHTAIVANAADVVMCNYQKVFDNGQIEKVNYTKNFKYASQEKYIALSQSSFCLLMINRNLFNNIRIPSFKNGEDMAVIPVLLSRAKGITFVNDVLYSYYIRNNSLSNKPDSGVYKSLLEAYGFINENMEGKFAREREFLGINILLYGVVLNALKTGVHFKDIKVIVEKFNRENVNWKNNKYLGELVGFRKYYVRFVDMRIWPVLWLLSKMHYLYTRK